MKKIILTLFVVVAMLLNFNLVSKADKVDVSLNNIKALQASAGEAYCKDTSSNVCKITLPSGVIIEGIGQPYAEW